MELNQFESKVIPLFKNRVEDLKRILASTRAEQSDKFEKIERLSDEIGAIEVGSTEVGTVNRDFAYYVNAVKERNRLRNELNYSGIIGRMGEIEKKVDLAESKVEDAIHWALLIAMAMALQDQDLRSYEHLRPIEPPNNKRKDPPSADDDDGLGQRTVNGTGVRLHIPRFSKWLRDKRRLERFALDRFALANKTEP